MTDAPLRRIFWRIVDALDYLLMLARLRILDALAGPEPESRALRLRKRSDQSSTTIVGADIERSEGTTSI